MKKLFARAFPKRHTGFTLVELLVVIAIIAILAGVVLNIGNTVLLIAKRTKAQNTATQIQTSALAYYTEYSVYPTPSGVSTDWELTDKDTISSGTGNWGNLIECLSGMISPSTGNNVATTETAFSNTRQIAFLNLKSTDVAGATATDPDAPLNPIPPYTGSSNGSYFNIAFDGDYDGVIGASTEAVSSTWLPSYSSGTVTLSGGSTTSGVAVWANCNYKSGLNSSAWWVHTY